MRQVNPIVLLCILAWATPVVAATTGGGTHGGGAGHAAGGLGHAAGGESSGQVAAGERGTIAGREAAFITVSLHGQPVHGKLPPPALKKLHEAGWNEVQYHGYPYYCIEHDYTGTGLALNCIRLDSVD